MRGRIAAARRLRCDQTEAERLLWSRLRDRRLAGVKFRRQAPIAGYVVDFACADLRLIIELDGSQHAVRAREDERRTRVLESCGYLVMRFWNGDVLDHLDGVVETVLSVLPHECSPPHPSPLPDREREQ